MFERPAIIVFTGIEGAGKSTVGCWPGASRAVPSS